MFNGKDDVGGDSLDVGVGDVKLEKPDFLEVFRVREPAV